MYNEFFGLEDEPFSVTPDPDFIFYGEQYKEALAHLLYGVQERRGMLLLTGRVGSGKTTLCRTLLRELEEETRTSFLRGSFDSPRDILRALARDWGVDVPEDASREKLYSRLQDFLLDSYQEGRNACLIVDESQNLSVECLEQLRLLSNLETNKDKLLQIVLVGQPELEGLLNQPELRQLKQRISIRSYLSHLEEDETRRYVQHRLQRAARGSPEVSIQPGVFRLLYEASQGNPRIINRLADRMLLAAYVDEASSVRKEHLNAALDDLSSETGEVDDGEDLILRRMKTWFEESGGVLDRLTGILPARYAIVAGSAFLTVFLGTALFGGWFGPWTEPTIVPPGQSPSPRTGTKETTPGEIHRQSPTKSPALPTDTRPFRVDTLGFIDRPDTREPLGFRRGRSRKNPDGPIKARPSVDEEEPSSSDTEPLESASTARAEEDTPPREPESFNALKLQPLEVKRLNEDTEALTLKWSIYRYMSYKAGKIGGLEYDTIPLSGPVSPPQTPSPEDRLRSGTPPMQLVRLEGSYTELRDLPYPLFVRTQSGPDRYVLSLPNASRMWDPVRGWGSDTEVLPQPDREGPARVLAPAPFDLNKLRSFEDTGPAIVRLQELLNGTGEYDLPLVGNYGPQTRRSIRDFQRRKGLLADGVGGPRTYLALLAENDEELRWSRDRIREVLE